MWFRVPVTASSELSPNPLFTSLRSDFIRKGFMLSCWYRGWDSDKAVQDYYTRIRDHEEYYDPVEEKDWPYIRIFNVGERIMVNTTHEGVSYSLFSGVSSSPFITAPSKSSSSISSPAADLLARDYTAPFKAVVSVDLNDTSFCKRIESALPRVPIDHEREPSFSEQNVFDRYLRS
ncbi:hypothetical protein DFJ43DRAFT_1041028 [Lentinula guzmanii]|uniref:6-phosphofructo-2-kinase domain-containing protein n=1 Tax=Lentinula guzmanii TaxID=2804957 RepID=A0AA38JGC7_9AGAR|nr:hypothetical protein DFJ43DRAFT_1041028 [Lentinula guzmanii]